jgi:hypothetical protein
MMSGCLTVASAAFRVEGKPIAGSALRSEPTIRVGQKVERSCDVPLSPKSLDKH